MTVTDVKHLSSLSALTDALALTTSALHDSEAQLVPTQDGISLLDVKNELLLSYLQNLTFLVLFKLRNLHQEQEEGDTTQSVQDELLHKLIELRVYLERGVRPLEGKLRYQIEQVVRAAENAKVSEPVQNPAQRKRAIHDDGEDDSNSDVSSNSESGSDSSFDDERTTVPTVPDSMNEGPRLHYQLAQQSQRRPSDSHSHARSQPSKPQSKDTLYRPPRLNPTSMPTPSNNPSQSARRTTSTILNDYIRDELSSTPVAQPSIGSSGTILNSGRSSLSARDREREKERRDYEESHFTRLPGESKADKRKRLRIEARRGGNDGDGLGGRGGETFGGEDWAGLGGLGDRVSRSVTSKGTEREGVMQRRDKRRRDRDPETQDGPRRDGMGGKAMGMGESFDKRRRVLQGREGKRGQRR